MPDLPDLSHINLASLQQVLGVDLDATARSHAALSRARKYRTGLQILTSVMLYSACDYSLREVAAEHTLKHQSVSDTAVLFRLKAACTWIQWLTQTALTRLTPDGKPLLDGIQFIVYDASIITSKANSDLQYRLHLSMDLSRFQISDLGITDIKTPESPLRLMRPQRSCWVSDRGNAHHPKLQATLEANEDFLVRSHPRTLPVYEPETQKLLDWDKIVGGLKPGGMLTHKGVLPFVEMRGKKQKKRRLRWDKGQWNVTVYIYRLTDEASQRARMRYRRRMSKKSKNITKTGLHWCDYVILVSSLSPELLDVKRAFELYRRRWQVELLFKRLKSVLDVDQLRTRKDSALAKTYLWAKMLYALWIEHQAGALLRRERHCVTSSPLQTPWRIWKMLKRQLTSSLTATSQREPTRWNQALKALRERKRRRKLHSPFPPETTHSISFFETCGLAREP